MWTKIIIILCLYCQTVLANITYDLYHEPQDEKLHIELEFTGDKTGKTTISIPKNIWGHDVGKQIKNYKILSSDCHVKESKNILLHKPSQKIKISYDIINVSQKDGSSYYSYSNKDGFYFLHHFALIYPKSQKEIQATVRYHSQVAKEIHTSFGKIPVEHSLVVSLDKLLGGFSICGSKDALIIDDNVLAFKVAKNKLSEIKHVLTNIISSQKDFCGSEVKDNLFVFINSHRESDSFYGTLLDHNVMLMFLPKNFTPESVLFKNTLAHENFHKWIGREVIKFNSKNEISSKWFFEGFTDYFSYKINLLNKIITFDKYLAIYNEVVKRYFTSPYKLVINKEISKKNYWELGKIAYYRGHIIAQELDSEVQKLSKGKYNLQSVLRSMIKMFQENKELEFSDSLLANVLQKVTGQNFKDKLTSMINGDINLSNNLLDKAVLSYEKVQSINYGFDFLKSTKHHKIINLDKKSNAYKAGLRNGDKFIKIHRSIYHDNIPNSKIIIYKTNGKNIKFVPNILYLKIPQFRSFLPDCSKN